MLIKEYLKGEFSRKELIEYLDNLGYNPLIIEDNEDLIFELEIPANRGDLLSIIGVCREILPMKSLSLQLPEINFEEKISEKMDVKVENYQDCPYYSCRIIKNVKVEPSPAWLKEKVEKMGFRSINNLVDISNFVTGFTGQPIHIFDLKKIKGGIVVRRGRENEEIETLDGKIRKLNSEILVISDSEKPIALAGIMGGKNSEVDDGTTSILIESAKFSPVTVRKGSKILGITTEASLRFEKETDIERVKEGLEWTTFLVKEVCGGEIGPLSSSGIYTSEEKKEIPLNINKLFQYLGKEISEDIITNLFKKISFSVRKEKNFFYVKPPVWRNDIKEDVDLIEEIAKYIGYSNIPSEFPIENLKPTPSESEYKKIEKIKDIMKNLGFNEVITSSLISEDIIKLTNLKSIPLLNPISKNFAYLRPSLTLSLLETAEFNLSKQIKNFKIFEIGKVYEERDRKYSEEYHLCLETVNEGDFFTLKGVVEEFLERCGIENIEWKKDSHPLGEDEKILSIFYKDTRIGFLFYPDEKLKEFFDLKKENIFIAEIYIQKILQYLFPKRYFQKLPKFPSSRRDLSFLIPQDISWQEIEKEIKSLKIPLEKIEVFDIYRGKNIPKDKISISFTLIFRDPERTLESEEVDGYVKEIVEVMENKFKAVMRK